MTTPTEPDDAATDVDLSTLATDELDGLAEFEHDGDPDVEFIDAPAEDPDAEHGANTEDEMSGGES